MWAYLIFTVLLYVGPYHAVGITWSPRFQTKDECETHRQWFNPVAPWVTPGDPLVATMRCQVWP